MTYILKAFVSVLSVIVMIISALPTNYLIPYLDVIPGMIEVGLDYIDLDFNEGCVTKKELKTALSEADDSHPFVLATKENFDIARNEYENIS